MAPRTRRLGKGLGALIPSVKATGGLLTVSIDAILPNPRQLRVSLDPDSLQDLADSIREVGLIQPLIVRHLPSSGGPTERPRYELIAGERRWRAAELAGLQYVEVVVKEATPQQTLELALVENIQREDLNPLEEASAYRQLSEEFGLTQEQIAERVGRSRVSVTNTLRLLRLPEQVKRALLEERISEGHGRAMLMVDDEERQIQVLDAIVKRHLSVRQTEELVRRLRPAGERPQRRRRRSAQTEALEAEFRDALGTRVDLFRGRKGGRLVVYFSSEEDLQVLYDRIVGD